MLAILKPKRSWFQYRLRTLLVFTALCGVAARWVLVPVEAARRQESAVNAIHARGGYCYWCRGKPMVPDWMRSAFGLEHGISISHVQFPRTGDDNDLALLDDLPNLHVLMGCGSTVTDAGVKHIQRLTELWSVNLCGTQITDAGLSGLRGLAELKTLNLAETRIGDAGLEQIRGLRSLETLDLSQTQVTDAGLHYLKELNKLHSLNLRGTSVTASGLNVLEQSLPNCEISIGPPLRL